MSDKKEKRPSIPPKTQFKLWLKSGGRCQLCNKLVYKDGYTLSEGNWSNIAHIISWSASGPRGDKLLSPKSAKEYSNLMLMCNEHAKLIDTPPYIAEYTKEKLKSIKHEHEKRIETLTQIKETSKTHPLIIQSNIGGNPVEININEVKTAVIKNKMYPYEEPFVIDLTGDNGHGDSSFYEAKAKEISIRVKSFIDKYNANTTRQHISIFPLALMPLLVHLGKELGDKHSNQLFQHHRESGSWVWTKLKNFPPYIVNKPTKVNKNSEVFLKISLSDYIGQDKLNTIPEINNNIYEITISNPNPHFLINRDQLTLFDKIYRHLLNEIENLHGKDCNINLLLAVPCPIAVQCGMSMLIRKESQITVFDYDSVSKGFFKALVL